MAKVQMGERPLGAGGAYTADEIDAMLAGIASGAPAGGFTSAAPLRYSTPEVSSSGGKPIGVSADGTTINRPPIVAGIPVIVDGKRYLIALISE